MPKIFGFNNNVNSSSFEGLPPAMCSGILADLTLLGFLRDVAPVLDANMFMLYGSDNGYDISTLSVTDLRELATTYKKNIETYIDDKIKSKLIQTVNRWWSFINHNNYEFCLPEPIYRQFRNVCTNIETLKYRFNNLNTEPIAAAVQSIHTSFVLMTQQDYPGLNELIPVDKKMCEQLFNNINNWTAINIADRFADVKQRYTLNCQILDIAACILKLICCGSRSEFKLDSMSDYNEVYRRCFAPGFKNADMSVKIFVRKCRSLQPCHVLAMNGNWNDNLIVSRTPIIQDNAASKMAYMIFVSNGYSYVDREIDKCVKNEEDVG